MSRPLRARHPSPVLFHTSIALAVVAFGVLGLWLWLGGRWAWPQWVGAWLVAVNLTAFGYYGLDKAQARRACRRVPEVVLHGLALAGGSVGAYASMRLFHHKTVKGSFRVVFWLIVATQVVLMLWVAQELWWAHLAAPA